MLFLLPGWFHVSEQKEENMRGESVVASSFLLFISPLEPLLYQGRETLPQIVASD